MNDVSNYLHDENYNIFGDRKKDSSLENVYTWWLDFITCLVYLPYPKDYHLRLVTSLKDYYKDHLSKLAALDEFERTYQPSDAIRWYTRDSFVYRLLNNASRRFNIELMFLFGFFVQDMYKQLKVEHQNFKVTQEYCPVTKVYRGQRMSQNEIQLLKNDNEPKFTLANNSFFSTSCNREVAKMFLNPFIQPTDKLQNVLFEIEINLNEESVPYANISHLSYMNSEVEVLFMIGAQFIPSDISYNEVEQVWTIKLLFKNSRERKGDEYFSDFPLKRKLLNCMQGIKTMDVRASYERDTQVIFDELINLYPEEKWIPAVQLASRGIYRSDRGQPKDFNVISDYEHALEIWHAYIDDDELNAYREIADIHENLACDCYEYDKNDRDKSKKHYDLAIKYYKLALNKALTNDETKGILRYLVSVSDSRMEITDSIDENILIGKSAIEYRKLHLQHLINYYSANDTNEIARFSTELADLQMKMHEYEDALLNYKKALEIHFKPKYFLPDEVMSIYRQMAVIHFKYKHDYLSALEYQLLKHKIVLKSSTPQPEDDNFTIDQNKVYTATSHLELAEIYIALYHYDLATIHLKTAMNINEERNSKYILDVSASYYENFANIYIATNKCELGVEYLQKAMELYKELKQQHIEEPDKFRHLDYEIEQLIENDEAKIESIMTKLADLHNH